MAGPRSLPLRVVLTQRDLDHGAGWVGSVKGSRDIDRHTAHGRGDASQSLRRACGTSLSGITNLGGIMDRWTLMIVRAYLPATFALAVSFALLFAATRFRDMEVLAGLAESLGLAFAVALGFASLHALWMAGRLWRAERGRGLLCDCGGLLGRERPGVRGQTNYRRCLACGRAVSSRSDD